MKIVDDKAVLATRLDFLVGIILKEIKHLEYSDKRVFETEFSTERDMDEVLSEKIEAFGSRFSRLQDTVGDKLLPLWLSLVGENSGAFIDNLNKAEKLNMLSSAERWLEVRQLRNKMVHEHINDFKIFIDSLKEAHSQIPFIKKFAENIINDIENRKLRT